MKLLLSLFAALFFSASLFAQVTVSGKITDEKNAPVPFATVYVKNTTIGTSANSEGEYTLNVNPGHYEFVFRAVGYKQDSRPTDVKTNQTLNAKLLPESYLLKDVTISAKGEDPAYAIMRKAIKKRKFYLNEVNAYSCEVYIKGLQKMLDAPKKFLGRDLTQALREAGLDSNRRGIIYLSESESKYSFERPNNVHEEMISSKVSGRNRGFSYNRASDMKVNFYENLQNWQEISNRPLVSPLADDAMLYYKYKLLGESVENGETIYKISLGPRRGYDPCFEGVIYILKDSWRLYGLDLMLTKKANINFVDTLKINQQFFPVGNNVWMTSSSKFDFTAGLFGFRVGGYFISVYKDYNLQPNTPKKDFKEVMRITRDVNKKDSLYWANERPIPLTDEEKNDYFRKEKLAKHRESKEYLDSLDRRSNRFDFGRLLLGGGYTHRNRYEKETYSYDSFLGSMLFNTVEGVAFNYGASFTKQIDSVTNRYMRVGAHVRYGFADNLFNANVDATIPLNGVRLNVAGGSDVVDLNNRGSITSFMNSAYSLFDRENFEKLYQKDYINASVSGRLAGGWVGSAGLEWANRKWLPNASSFSVFSPSGHQYTSNNPLTPTIDAPLFPENQAFKLNLRTSYNFSNKYETYPNGRRYLPSDYPTIGFNYTKGISGVFGSDVNYDLISADITKSNISLGMYGQSSFYVSAGKFLNAKSLYFSDYKQFSGGQILFYQPNITHFLLLDYYRFSTYTEYLEGHFEHNFSGFILNKIPLIRKLKLKEIVDVNYLTTPTLHDYTELGIGVEYFGFRLMYGRSYNSGGNVHEAVRLSIGF